MRPVQGKAAVAYQQTSPAVLLAALLQHLLQQELHLDLPYFSFVESKWALQHPV